MPCFHRAECIRLNGECGCPHLKLETVNIIVLNHLKNLRRQRGVQLVHTIAHRRDLNGQGNLKFTGQPCSQLGSKLL
ncbi:hypothetical protein D3C73_1423540 [compost metagenome]